MFNQMMQALKAKLDDGNGGYEWNCDAVAFYDAMREMALAGIVKPAQWHCVNSFIEVNVK